MTNITRGGRGKVAPYETTHYRIPLPIKGLVEHIAVCYKYLVGSIEPEKASILIEELNKAVSRTNYKVSHPEDVEGYKMFVKDNGLDDMKDLENNAKSKDEIEMAIKDILKQKRSAKVSMELLLKKLYPNEENSLK